MGCNCRYMELGVYGKESLFTCNFVNWRQNLTTVTDLWTIDWRLFVWSTERTLFWSRRRYRISDDDCLFYTRYTDADSCQMQITWLWWSSSLDRCLPSLHCRVNIPRTFSTIEESCGISSGSSIGRWKMYYERNTVFIHEKQKKLLASWHPCCDMKTEHRRGTCWTIHGWTELNLYWKASVRTKKHGEVCNGHGVNGKSVATDVTSYHLASCSIDSINISNYKERNSALWYPCLIIILA